VLKISVRNIERDYKEIKLTADNTEVDLGLYNLQDRYNLALHLLDVVDDLFPNDDEVYSQLDYVREILDEKYA